jgi:acylpyruvate hydrolase
MRIVNFEKDSVTGIAADSGSGWRGVTQRDSGFPGTVLELTVAATSSQKWRNATVT